ncbi:MAG: hypothetical protein WDN46_08365 [Methylocella sp.]
MVATLAVAIMQWAIMLFVAHFDGPVLVGQYALAQAYATPAGYLAWLSIRQQYLVAPADGASFADFVFLRTVAPLIVFGALLIFIGFAYDSPQFFWIASGVFAMKYVEGFFDLAYGKMQRSGDIAGVALTNLVRGGLSIPLFGGFYITTHSLPLSLFAVSALWVALFFIDRKRLAISVAASDLFDMTMRRLRRRRAIVFDLFPVGMSLVIMSLAIYAPRFLIEAALGPKELGFFSAVGHFLTVGGIAAGSIGQSLLPHLADAISNHSPRSFWRQLLWPVALIQGLSIIGVFLAIAIGSQLLGLFYGVAFAGQGRMLVAAALVAGPIYAAGIITNGCFAAQMRRAFFAIQCISLAAIIIATLVLVPRFGVDGAFAAMMIAAIAQISISIVLLVRFFASRELQLAQT